MPRLLPFLEGLHRTVNGSTATFLGCRSVDGSTYSDHFNRFWGKQFESVVISTYAQAGPSRDGPPVDGLRSIHSLRTARALASRISEITRLDIAQVFHRRLQNCATESRGPDRIRAHRMERSRYKEALPKCWYTIVTLQDARLGRRLGLSGAPTHTGGTMGNQRKISNRTHRMQRSSRFGTHSPRDVGDGDLRLRQNWTPKTERGSLCRGDRHG